MAEKFSQFNVENTLTSVTGIVGFITGSPGTNIKITPAKLSEGLGFVGNVLSTSAGGTSISTYSTGMILYSDAANSLATLPISATTGDILKVSASGIPEWGSAPASGVTTIDMGSTGFTPTVATSGAVSVGGTLVAGAGGTGRSSYSVGSLLAADSASSLGELSAGTATHVLTSNGPGVLPSWQAAGGGGSSPWTTSGNNIYNNNTSNVGIGSTNPGSRLTIEGSGSSGMSNALQIQQNGGAAWLTASDAGTLSLTSSMSSLGKLSCAQFQLTSSPVAGRVLTSDGAGNGSWQASGGGFPSALQTINGSVNPASAGTVYIINTNSMSINAVVTLPAGLSANVVGVKWASQSATNQTCSVKTQTGKKIDGVVRDTTTLQLPSVLTYYEFICDSNGDWFIK